MAPRLVKRSRMTATSRGARTFGRYGPRRNGRVSKVSTDFSGSRHCSPFAPHLIRSNPPRAPRAGLSGRLIRTEDRCISGCRRWFTDCPSASSPAEARLPTLPAPVAVAAALPAERAAGPRAARPPPAVRPQGAHAAAPRAEGRRPAGPRRAEQPPRLAAQRLLQGALRLRREGLPLAALPRAVRQLAAASVAVGLRLAEAAEASGAPQARARRFRARAAESWTDIRR